MLYSIVKTFDEWLSFDEASAHCDIPCKIYDPMHGQLNVLTIIRLLDLIQPLLEKESLSGAEQAQLSRLVSQKESHGAQLKDDIRVIWGDYFKQPQLTEFPEIHALTHSIMLMASRVKQEISKDDALELLKLVNRFAFIFWSTKKVATFEAECPYPPHQMTVYPDLKVTK